MGVFKDLRERLMRAVGERVEEYGFNLVVRAQAFHRKKQFGWVSLHLAFIPHEDDFDVIARIAVRFNALEDLLAECDKDSTKQSRRETASLGAEFGYLIHGEHKYWTVEGPEDIDPVAEEIAKAFVVYGLPYFKKYSSTENALEALSGDGPTALLYCGIDSLRAMRAVGLAYLSGDKKRFEELVERKRRYLEEKKDREIGQFLHLIEALAEKDR